MQVRGDAYDQRHRGAAGQAGDVHSVKNSAKYASRSAALSVQRWLGRWRRGNGDTLRPAERNARDLVEHFQRNEIAARRRFAERKADVVHDRRGRGDGTLEG